MKIFAMVAAMLIGGISVASAQCGPDGCSPVRRVVGDVRQVVQGVTLPVQNFVQNRQVVMQQRYQRQYRRTRYGVVPVLVPVYVYTYTVQ